jgi:hypothetical protein
MHHRVTAIVLGLLANQLASMASCADDISFTRDVLPVLSDKCFTCHGPDAEKREADLRLDEEASARESAIVPGNAAASELFRRITSSDPDLQMPPPESKYELARSDIEIIRRWIDSGATWQTHWAFEPLTDVEIPEVANNNRHENEIDPFIVSRLLKAELVPAPEASREQLIRRLTFDLTGLPPTLNEIDAFLQDKQPDAYDRVVDRLLQAETYGERMTADWLDVARYSDTYGYQVDRDRFVWPWRDWVVRAFNNNMPYDQFITEQLAGDLLPDATDDQILATTFNRLHPQKVEGGSVPEEFRIEYVSDRTQTFGTAFLGLTLECCRCHDHKYDPLTQKEYYQLSAFFDNIDEAGLYSYFTSSVPTPTLILRDDATRSRLKTLAEAVDKAEQQVRTVAAAKDAEFETWLKTFTPEEGKYIPGRIDSLDFESGISGGNQQVSGRFGHAVKLSGDDGIGLKTGNFKRFEPFTVSLWMNTPDIKERAVIFHRSRAWTDAASRGYQLLLENGRLSASLIHFWPGNAIRIRTKEPITVREWHHVVVSWDGSSRADGLTIYLNGETADCEVVQDNLYKNITGGGGDNITIGERFRDRGFTNGLVDEFQVYNRRLTEIEVRQLFDGKSLIEAIQHVESKSGTPSATDLAETARLKVALRDYFLATADTDYQQAIKSLRDKREALATAGDGLQEIMVMRERSQPTQTYLLKRGAYDARAVEVSTETPASLPPFPEDTPRNRSGLARWLTSPQHPLTARVAVNRLWQIIFGEGLVRTPEDFGRQGQPPTHPELLDWLARDFVKHDWDVKRLLKLIVSSATYRQSSIADARSLARDPQNLLLSRSPTYRLPAEMLRDHALAVSGLLVRKVGGPPARPYEVEVSFKPVKKDSGEGLYRRSLYTYWKRTGPAPVMMTLDASKRDVCRMRRERTSTPLEAFVLMNGPQFVEAARVLSERLMREHGDTSAPLIPLFRTLTSRAPTEQEVSIVKELYSAQLEYFQKNNDQADAYLKSGERKVDDKLDKAQLAALTSVANALFSFDEVLNRH